MAYKAPIWEDGKSPAISAENLNNLSQAAEGAQVLYGNSVPTSSTEGAVGQFYLVVVPDSDGNYPLYQCVAIANGSYTWRDTRRIPDSITSMLGIPAPGTINRALNVLANVGNLHVWERVQTYAEPVPEVPAGYTLGEVETDVTAVSVNTTSPGAIIKSVLVYYANEPTVYSNGNLSIDTGNEVYINSTNYNEIAKLKGKFISVGDIGQQVNETDLIKGVIYYIPSDSIITYSNDNPCWVKFSKIQRVTGYPYTPAIPAGTTTDYLTSTDRNAYPDQSAEGGQDAYYTLGDVVSGKFELVSDNIANIAYYKAGTGVTVSENGALTLTGATSVKIQSSEWSTIAAQLELLRGKYCSIINYEGGAPVFANFDVFYIPEDVVFTIPTKSNQVQASVSKYQPVTGHAAIPANTTITYLGQLGGGARIEVGTYVGTGTYGYDNPNTLTFEFEPKLIVITETGYGVNPLESQWNGSVILVQGSYSMNVGTSKSCEFNVVGKNATWYTKGNYSGAQLNESGITYNYIAIG